MYFASFPKIFYDSTGQGKPKSATNLLRRVAIRSKVKDNAMLYDTYDIKNGETPESIADKLYDDPQLHWVVLLVNDITDRYHQWPMTVPQFEAYIADKYTNPDGIHHYTIPKQSGDTTEVINIGTDNTSHPTATTVSNRQFELDLQTEYSKIRLIHSDFINQFITEFEDLMNEGTSI